MSARLKAGFVIVQEGSGGQLTATIPCKLAKVKNIKKGDVLRFESFFQDSILLKKVQG